MADAAGQTKEDEVQGASTSHLTTLVSGEIDRQLKDRNDALDVMKSEMSRVIHEFEDMSWNLQSKRSWNNSVHKNKELHSPSRVLPKLASSPKKKKKKQDPIMFGYQLLALRNGGTINSVSGAAAAMNGPGKVPGAVMDWTNASASDVGFDFGSGDQSGPPPTEEDMLVAGESKTRSPERRTMFDKKLPRVAIMEQREAAQSVLMAQQKQQMYEKALVKYPQCRSNVFVPSAYEESHKTMAERPAPATTLELEYAYGYHNAPFHHAPTGATATTTASASASGNCNVVYLASGEILWYSASILILYNKETRLQRFFRGHTSEISCVALHPNQQFVASGQVGRDALVLVWDSSEDPLGKTTFTLKGTSTAVRCLSFSHDGKFLASLGCDLYNSIHIFDWRQETLVTSAKGHTFRVHCIAFNPFQAYGCPDSDGTRKPGQALTDDDACYTLVSCGVRHIRFWTLAKAEYEPTHEDHEDEHAFTGSTFGGPAPIRPRVPHDKIWKLEGNVPSFNGKLSVHDFTCLAFVDDSPPLHEYDESQKQMVQLNESDRTLGRIIAGTSKGDICVFWQPRRAPVWEDIPPRFRDKEPVKWWEIPEDFTDSQLRDLVIERIVFEPNARLVEMVPHDVETGNRFKLSKQAQAEIENIAHRLALKPNSQILFSRMEELSYKGPVAHDATTLQLAYSRKHNLIISSGVDGKLVLWRLQMPTAIRVPGIKTLGVFTPYRSTLSEGVHTLLPIEEKVFHFPTADSQGQKTISKPTSVAWKDDGNTVIVGASNNSIWELDVQTGVWTVVSESSSSGVVSCCCHPFKEELVTLTQDGVIAVWDLESHSCKKKMACGMSSKGGCLDFAPAGDHIAAGMNTGEILIVEYPDLRVFLRKLVRGQGMNSVDGHASFPVGASSSAGVCQIRYSPDSKVLATGTRDKLVHFHDVGSNYKKFQTCVGHSSAVSQMTWSLDGGILMSNDGDGEMLFWSVTPSKSAKQIKETYQYRDVVWSRWTCVFGWPTPGIWNQDTTRLFDINCVCTTGIQSNANKEMASEDLLVVACRSTIRLFRWPAFRGAKFASYAGHACTIADMCFTGNDRYLISVGGDDFTILQWKTNAVREIKSAPCAPKSENSASSSSIGLTPVPPSDKQQQELRSPRPTNRSKEFTPQTIEQETQQSTGSVSPQLPPDSSIRQWRVLQEFKAEHPDELSLQVGETIRVLAQTGEDWWSGERGDGTRGIFPKRFVQEIGEAAVTQ